MLFCSATGRWKIGDFGTCSDATSKQLCTTKFSRGTASYRAPEILAETNPKFNNKADIWALGCIVYELFMHAKAFSSDWAVIRYASSRVLSLPTCFPSTLRNIQKPISAMLSLDPSERPSAKTLLPVWSELLEALDPDHEHAFKREDGADALVAPVLTNQRPRILSLDGGGVRSLSSLLILREIMKNISHSENSSETLLPSKYFDLICGSGMGGVFAIMFGRLQMVSDSIFKMHF